MRFFSLTSLFFLLSLQLSCADGTVAKQKPAASRHELPDSGEITGAVVRVIDGDTYDLMQTDNNPVRIRLAGIDCPERAQDFYQAAKKRLGEICRNKPVVVRYTSRDRNGRIVGHTYLEDGTWVNAQLVREGLAWHFLRYSKDTNLSAAELAARAARMNIWSVPDPVAPWDYRSMQRKKP